MTSPGWGFRSGVGWRSVLRADPVNPEPGGQAAPQHGGDQHPAGAPQHHGAGAYMDES